MGMGLRDHYHWVRADIPCRGADVQIAWERRHFMDGTPFYATGVGDHLL